MAGGEARLGKAKGGLIPEERGWFVVNAAEARWKDTGPFGLYCPFEGKQPFLQLGINISVLQPGQSLGRYHLEPGHEEDFLVLEGECILVVEEQERRLTRWDFFHCPPGVAHMIVGSGDGPATVLSVGTRGNGKGVSRGDHLSGLGGSAAARRLGGARDERSGGGVRGRAPIQVGLI